MPPFYLLYIGSNPGLSGVLTVPADDMQTDMPQPHEEIIMANTTFNGPVRSQNGFQSITVSPTTGNVRYKARERYSFGWSDPLGMWGSPGA